MASNCLTCKITDNDAGFSLIELALVLVITGILLTSMTSVLMVYIKYSNLSTTKQKLDTIDQALQDYLNAMGSLPCPAPVDAAVNSATYGIQVVANPATGCPAGPPGIVSTAGTGGRTISSGAVPTRTINLPDDYMFDAWGDRFTYAVTDQLTTPQYDRTKGAISVIDNNGNSAINPAGSAHYVIVSHGPDGVGAYTVNGVAGVPCDATTLDGENCNNDAIFRRTLVTGTGPAIGHYDDVVKYRAVSAFGEAMPPGAVIGFNLAACPPGWTAFNQGIGRFIVGAGSYTGNYSFAGRANWSANSVYAVGDVGGYQTWRTTFDEIGADDTADNAPSGGGATRFVYSTGTAPTPEENRPPFIALLYCQKT